MSAWGASSPFRSCDPLIRRIEQNDPTLKDLVILPTKKFGAAEVGRLCAVLERQGSNANTHWTSLSASGHSIPVEVLRRLGKSIANTSAKNFRSIAIGDRNMGDEGVSAFCEGLQGGCHSLEHVDLSFKGLNRGFHSVLCTLGKEHKALKRLNLSRNPGIGSSCTDLSEFRGSVLFPGVEEIDLTDCGITSAVAAQLFPLLVPETGTLRRTLRLSSNPLGATGFDGLTGLFPSTDEFYMADCELGDEAMEVLKSRGVEPDSATKVIDISGNSIGTKGISWLADCLAGETAESGGPFLKHVEELILARNTFGGEGTEMLIRDGLKARSDNGLPTLKLLDLSETGCGVRGAVMAVQESGVVSLRLFNNNLGSEGFRELAVIARAGLPKTLESLDLAGNSADVDSVLELLGGLLDHETRSATPSSLKTLIIGGNRGGSEVEHIIHRIQMVRPDLDIARDKPKRKE